MFFGIDDGAKIKSIKARSGYIAITHFEEADQFSGMEEIRKVLQSTMRGGNKFYNFMSYNPPRSRDNWINKEILISRKDRLIHQSTYLDVPREWLGDAFFDEAEFLKEIDPKAYEHEYLGVPVGTGGNVFDNVTIREITEHEIKSMITSTTVLTGAGILIPRHILRYIGSRIKDGCFYLTSFTVANYLTRIFAKI